MGTFLKISLAILALIVLGCAGLFFAAPSAYEVSREVTIDAPSESIHPFVEDLQKWEDWSYWHSEEYDPSLVASYSGADKGVGAISTWTGKDGPGGIEITASDPAEGMWFDLSFGEGEALMISKGVVLYEPAGQGTVVTMINRGEFTGWMKLFNLGADAMMGPAFEKSLQGLKQQTEALE